MPAIGTRHRSDNNLLVTTKVYGPTTTFMFDPRDLLREVRKIVDGDIVLTAKSLATEITGCVAKLVQHDPNATWVDCEVLGSDGVLYYDVAVLAGE